MAHEITCEKKDATDLEELTAKLGLMIQELSAVLDDVSNARLVASDPREAGRYEGVTWAVAAVLSLLLCGTGLGCGGCEAVNQEAFAMATRKLDQIHSEALQALKTRGTEVTVH